MSGSGLEAMGAHDMRAAVTTLAAFLAAQDIYKSAPGIARDVAAGLTEAWWTHQLAGNVVTVQIGAASRQFLQSVPGNWIAPGGDFATLTQTGSRVPYEQVCAVPSNPDPTPPYALSRGWNYSGMSFAVTNAHGDVEHFGYWSTNYSMNDYDHCGFAQGFRLTSWTFPQGPTVTLTYGNKIDFANPGSGYGFDQLLSVSNNLGRQIDFTSDGRGHLTGFTNHLTGGDLRTVAVGSSTLNGQPTTTVTDPMGATTSYTTLNLLWSPTQRPVAYPVLFQVYTPDHPTSPNLQYDYDGLGRVKQVRDAENLQMADRAPWTFFLADGTRGDPLNEAYAVTYDIYGHPWRFVDELGRETDQLSDGRGRVLSNTYPEHDCEAFAYDDRDNTTDLWRVDKASACNTSAGASHVLHTSATWDPTWNKPLSVTDIRGNTTTLTYYNSGNGASLLHTATRPTIAEGTPVYSFTYDSNGKPLTSVAPLTASQTITTTNSYDSAENLTATTLDPSHLALTTGFGYDANGNVTSTTDPRGYVTTSLYDLDRRKTEDDHHDGNASATLNAASQSVYDAVGRVTDTKAGTVFSGTAVTAWQTMAHTTYTPTSKVASVTDADGRVSTTSYDPADRVSVTTDPALRQTAFVYDAAGEVLTKTLAYGNNLAAVYVTNTYTPNGLLASVTDALGPTHLTTYTHDGFDRLITTTFPDATHEDLTYVDGSGNLCSANGSPCTKRNRAGEVLTFTYNALDGMLTKVSPNPAVTTSWTYELNGAPSTLSDTAGNTIAYGYDTAGRRITEAQTIPGLTGAKTVTSTLDASSNRTGLTWADGYAVTYGFDSLNRMTSAADSANTLATYGYDPLSRRTSASYAGGTSGASYGYSNAGDLLTLTDDLAGTTNDVTFTNTFTPAHQIASAAISNTAFRYTPPGNGTIAYTVNTLNQYATLNGTTQLYDARGNITGATSTPNIYIYDAENRMVALGAPFTGSSYAFDPLGRRTSKTISGVTTNFVHDGDTEIAEYDGSGNLIRRFVPGPAIDEYIAMVTATGTKTFFTTDKMGSVIAMADLSGNMVEGPYLYDSYGTCRVGGTYCNATGVPFRFTGQRLDAETGALYYRARMYSTGSGRFFQTDPVGYTADINLYTAFGNDPTDRTDPSGETDCNCMSSMDEDYYNRGMPSDADVADTLATTLSNLSDASMGLPQTSELEPGLKEGAVLIGGLAGALRGAEAAGDIAKGGEAAAGSARAAARQGMRELGVPTSRPRADVKAPGGRAVPRSAGQQVTRDSSGHPVVISAHDAHASGAQPHDASPHVHVAPAKVDSSGQVIRRADGSVVYQNGGSVVPYRK